VAAQTRKEEKPSEVLAGVLVAACRQNEEQFAKYQTQENAEAFRQLPPGQRIEVMKRFALLSEPGRPLLSNDPDGRTQVRCETTGVTAVFRFGEERIRENLAFIPVDVNDQRRAEFGLVREGGGWKILSLGLLLLNLPELAKQWAAQVPLTQAPEAQTQPAAAPPNEEEQAVQDLRRLREAILKFRRAFGALPEKLEQLGPPPGREGVSPDRARLVDEDLAAGHKGSYAFALRIVPAAKEGEESTFALTATPLQYGKRAKQSFYLDAEGTLRGGDKQGAVATAADPSQRNP
jgi:hypothetical protein